MQHYRKMTFSRSQAPLICFACRWTRSPESFWISG